MRVDVEWEELYPYPKIHTESDPYMGWRFTDAWNQKNLRDIPEDLYRRWVAMDKERAAVSALLKAVQPDKVST